MRPRVSILLPACNAERTLPACLRSVARQRLRDWECVVVDDGSRDATGAIARVFAAGDPRFRVLPIPHAGLVGALRAGLARCRGDLVARMDADDLMHRERLGAQAAALARDPGLSAVGCQVRLFPRSALTDGLLAYERWLNGIQTPRQLRAESFVECPVAHPTLMIRRPVLAAAGYRDEGWPEDYDLILRLLSDGHKIGVVPRRLLAWRDQPNRLWRTSAVYGLARFVALRARFLATGFLSGEKKYVLWGYGETGKALRRALAVEEKLPSHIVELHPGRLGKKIHGAPVIAPDALARMPRRPIVVSGARAKARGEIRETLEGMGFRETAAFVCAA
ncbi:MAG: glycosyltransferase family 2 protein [Myxococcota bacterium]